MIKQQLARQIANLVQAVENLKRDADNPHNAKWIERHRERAEKLTENHMPSGSGFDSGTKLDFDASSPERLVFRTSYHHMREGGYTGWTDHTVIVTPSLVYGICVNIRGRTRRLVPQSLRRAQARRPCSTSRACASS